MSAGRCVVCGGGDEGGMTCPQVDVCVWWGG